MVLAHLHLVVLKEREQSLHPVDDNAVNRIAVTLDPGECLGIVRCALMGDMLQIQRASAGSFKGYQYAAVTTKVSRVKLYYPMAMAYRVVPRDADASQETLHS